MENIENYERCECCHKLFWYEDLKPIYYDFSEKTLNCCEECFKEIKEENEIENDRYEDFVFDSIKDRILEENE